MDKPIPEFQRWSMTKGSDGARWSVYMDHDPHGEWVKWAEAQQHCLAITATQQQEQATDCHCATCTCQPGMTPAVRFDTTPADKEGAVRDHLIALGWTPPGAQQQGKAAACVACEGRPAPENSPCAWCGLTATPPSVPEARGVVRHDLCDCPNGRAEHSPYCAALTEARNVR